MVLENPRAGSFTAVSNLFLDQYMPEANGEFVKIYLYLLRQSGVPGAQISVSAIADHLNHTEKDVLRALHYWEKQSLLQILETDGEMRGIRLLSPGEKGTAKADSASPGAAAEKKTEISEETLERLQQEEDFSDLLFAAEQYLKRTLTPQDIRVLGYMREELQFPEDLIEYLIEYCVENGHRNIRYLEKVALNWHQEGILTREMAKESNQTYTRENREVMKAFGISGRVLAAREQRFVEKWLKEYGMPLEVAVEACAVTMSAIHKPSFEYADQVLASWRTAGIRTLEQARNQTAAKSRRRRTVPAERAASAGSRGFRNYDQRETDYDALLAQGKLGG